VIDAVRRQRPALASVLEHAVVLEMGSQRAVIGYDAANAFLFAQATEPGARQLLTAALRACFGRPVELVLDTVAQRAGTVSVAQIDSAERRARVDAARRAVAEHPLVTAAIELLGAELKDIRLAQDAVEG
jgi:DNA polymerase-3 subunit gamma/tau